MYNFNSSKSSIYQNENELFTELAKRLKDTTMNEDKILLICHKANATKLEKHLQIVGLSDVLVHEKEKEYGGQQIVINWYGNIVGRNEYSNFNKCWLIGTPNLPFEQYLVHYQQYSNIEIGNKGLDINVGRFVNETFASVQVGYVAAEMYQALKRIQRVTVPNGEFNLITHDSQIVEKVLKRIRGSEITNSIDFDFKVKKDQDKENKKHWQTTRLEMYLLGLEKGVYEKKDIYEPLGIDRAHFSDFLKRDKILRLVEDGIIRIKHRTIERL